MLWPLTWAVIIGTIPGVFIGAWIRIAYLPDPKQFKLFVGFVLLYIGWRLLLDVLKKKLKNNKTPESHNPASIVHVSESSIRKVIFEYNNEIFQFSTPVIYTICFLVGIIGGIYGIGGGAIIAPFFVVIIGLPVYAIAGAALMGTFVTSVAGVIFYHFLARFYPGMSVSPDWLLGALLGAGGFAGMYLGARTQQFVPAKIIKGILCACILFVSGKYVLGYFV